MASSVLAKMAVQISANTAEFNKAINRVEGQLTGFGKTITGIQNKLVGFAAGYSALRIGEQIIQSFADFQFEMSKVQAITQATGKQFRDLRNNAIDLGSTYGYTTKSVASLQLEFGRLGFSTKEILNSSKAAVLLAKATGEDLASSAQIAGSTLRSFNLDASEMGRITDVMAAAFNKSALGLSDFGEAIKYVAPVAASAGLSLEQTSAMLGVLADNGIKGSMAGTSLRKIISDLGKGAAPMLTQKLQEMARAGLSGAEAMDEVGRTAYASLLILAKNTSKIDEATTAYSNANGELQKMADIMADNLIGDWQKLTGAVDAAIQKMAEGKDSEIRNWLKELAAGVKLLSDETLGWTQKLEILFSPDWEKKWKEWSRNTTDAADSQNKLTKWDAQLLINKYEGIEQAMVGLNEMTVLSVAFDKEQSRQYQNREAIMEELKNRLEERAAAIERGLKKEAAAAMETGRAYDFLSGRVAKMWMAKNADTPNAFLGPQKTPVTPIPGQSNIPLDEGIFPTAGDPFGLDKLQKYVKQVNDIANQVDKLSVDLSGTLGNFISNMAMAFGKSMAGTVSFGDAFLRGMADFAVQFGEVMIAAGIAGKAIKEFGKNNPVAAIIAGAALVAIGSALGASLNSGLNNAASGNGLNTSSSMGYGGTIGSGRVQTQDSFYLEFRIRGRDLVAAYDANMQDNQLRGLG